MIQSRKNQAVPFRLGIYAVLCVAALLFVVESRRRRSP